jgi:hypothetical protein
MKEFSQRARTPMTWAFALLLTAGAHAAVSAQNTGMRTNFFLAPEARVSKVGGETAVATGFNTGWIINNSLILGGTSFSTNYGIEPTISSATGDQKAEFRYRGGMVGWAFQPSPSVKASITTVIGKGRLQGVTDAKTTFADRFWVFEPMANVNLRLNRWASLSAGAGYRFTAGGEFEQLGASDLRSPTARIGVTLGGW